MGAAHIMAARAGDDQPERRQAARKHLALALAVRPFHFETLYYLAELAFLEKKISNCQRAAEAFADIWI